MGKERNTYRTYTTSMLKTRSSIPSAGDIAEHVGHIDCANISLNAVSDLLDNTTHSLYTLARHANINHWSAFGPTIRSTTGSDYDKVLVNSDPADNCSLGSFAGYNHSAVTPGWQTGGQAAAEADNWVNESSQAVVSADIDIGEIDWENDFAALGVAMLIFDEADQIVGWGYEALSGIGSNFTLSGDTTIGGGIVEDKSWYAMAFIVDQTITDPEDVISAMVCRVPNISTWEVNLKLLPATFVNVDSGGFTISGAGYANRGTPDDGFVGISDGTYAGYWDEVRLYANIYDIKNAVLLGSDLLLNTWYSWSPTDQMFGNEGQPNGDWHIPAYGYQINIRVEVENY